MNDKMSVQFGEVIDLWCRAPGPNGSGPQTTDVSRCSLLNRFTCTESSAALVALEDVGSISIFVSVSTSVLSRCGGRLAVAGHFDGVIQGYGVKGWAVGGGVKLM